MKPSVYLETSVIGYLAMRPSSQVVTAGNQEITRNFWDNHRWRFELVISLAVLDECQAGDPVAVMEREQFLADIPILDVTADVYELADLLVSGIPLPEKARVDAVHIAVAAVNGVDYLVTWNCKHIANPSLRGIIERQCRLRGFVAPEICTPLQLIEVDGYE